MSQSSASADASQQSSTTQAARGYPAHAASRWPASLATLAALILYVTLPDKLIFGTGPFASSLYLHVGGVTIFLPRWIVPILEVALVIPLTVTFPRRVKKEEKWARVAAIVLIGLINLANVISLGWLVYFLVHGGQTSGRELIISAFQIWLTNIIIFGLWYWELDGGGPAARCQPVHREPDFLFPQMANPDVAPQGWAPTFVDYLYLALTNATAFSPTDTMPLTEWSKMLMLIQSLASLLIVALVAARAVNILS